MAMKVVSVKCGFCGGAGKDPFGILSALATCAVCGGAGVVDVEAPYRPCRHCRATGAIKTLTCTVCEGKGVIAEESWPTVDCPTCGGSGDAPSAGAMACVDCHGRGRVRVDPEHAGAGLFDH